MSEKVEKAERKRAARRLLVPLLGVGVAAWAVRRRLTDRPDLTAGWQQLPPAPRPVPATPAGQPAPAAQPAPATEQPAEPPVAVHARAVPAAAAPATATVAAPALPNAPYGAGSVRAREDGSSPDPDYGVKGKIATRTFYAPGGSYYTRTRADVWFRTPDDARDAGFTERTRRPT